MEQIGEFSGIPVYIVDILSKTDTYLEIYNNKVYYKGEVIGKFNRKKMRIEDFNEEVFDCLVHGKPQPKTVESGMSQASTWKELLQPVDDMIKEMLEREL